MVSRASNYTSEHFLTQLHNLLASPFSQLQKGASTCCPAHLSGPERTHGHESWQAAQGHYHQAPVHMNQKLGRGWKTLLWLGAAWVPAFTLLCPTE